MILIREWDLEFFFLLFFLFSFSFFTLTSPSSFPWWDPHWWGSPTNQSHIQDQAQAWLLLVVLLLAEEMSETQRPQKHEQFDARSTPRNESKGVVEGHGTCECRTVTIRCQLSRHPPTPQRILHSQWKVEKQKTLFPSWMITKGSIKWEGDDLV